MSEKEESSLIGPFTLTVLWLNVLVYLLRVIFE